MHTTGHARDLIATTAIRLLGLLAFGISGPALAQALVLKAEATETTLGFIVPPTVIDSICLPGQFFAIERISDTSPLRWECLYRDFGSNRLSVASWGDLSDSVANITRRPTAVDRRFIIQMRRKVVSFDPVTVTEEELCLLPDVPRSSYSDVKVTDRDGDGSWELSVIRSDFLQTFDISSGCTPGEATTEVPWLELYGNSLPIAAQLDDDPQSEIISTTRNEVHVYDGKTLLEELSLGDLSEYHAATLLDWDDDGKDELFLTGQDGLVLVDPDDLSSSWNLGEYDVVNPTAITPIQWIPGYPKELAISARGILVILDPVYQSVLVREQVDDRASSSWWMAAIDYDNSGSDDLLFPGDFDELLWRHNPVGTILLQQPSRYSLFPGCSSFGVVVTRNFGSFGLGSEITIRDRDTLQPIPPLNSWGGYDNPGFCGEFDGVPGLDVMFGRTNRIEVWRLDGFSRAWETNNVASRLWTNFTIPEASCSGMGCQRVLHSESAYDESPGGASWLVLDTLTGLPLHESEQESNEALVYGRLLFEDINADGYPDVFIDAFEPHYGVPSNDEIRLYDGVTFQQLWATAENALSNVFDLGVNPDADDVLVALAGNGTSIELVLISTDDGSILRRRSVPLPDDASRQYLLTFVPRNPDGGSWLISSLEGDPVFWIDASFGGSIHQAQKQSWNAVNAVGNGDVVAANDHLLQRYQIPNHTVWAGGFE